MEAVHGPLKAAPKTPNAGLLRLPKNTRAGKIPVLLILFAISILVSVSANLDSQMLIRIPRDYLVVERVFVVLQTALTVFFA